MILYKLRRLAREFFRRFINFFDGPGLRLMAFKRTRDQEGRRQLYWFPWPALPGRWWEDPVLHFNKVGLIEIDWLWFTAGLYWHDNN